MIKKNYAFFGHICSHADNVRGELTHKRRNRTALRNYFSNISGVANGSGLSFARSLSALRRHTLSGCKAFLESIWTSYRICFICIEPVFLSAALVLSFRNAAVAEMHVLTLRIHLTSVSHLAYNSRSFAPISPRVIIAAPTRESSGWPERTLEIACARR